MGFVTRLKKNALWRSREEAAVKPGGNNPNNGRHTYDGSAKGRF